MKDTTARANFFVGDAHRASRGRAAGATGRTVCGPYTNQELRLA
jgi:hypothetical protein